MPDRTLEILVSVAAVSLISVVGATLLLGRGVSNRLLPLLVALAAGALIGDTFLHLIPHSVADNGGRFTTAMAWGVLGGLVGFFLIESVLHWHHHGEDVHEHSEEGIHHIGWMNLIGDGLHNLIDGMLIAGAWLQGPELGLATTIAVALHEIPQEFGDFGVLLHAGFTPRRAIFFNLLSGLAAVIGAGIVLLAPGELGLAQHLVPVAAGGFLYIACADLVPEMRKRARGMRLITTSLALGAGLGLMALVHEFEHCGHSHDHGGGHHHHDGGGDGHQHDDGNGHGHDHDGGEGHEHK